MDNGLIKGMTVDALRKWIALPGGPALTPASCLIVVGPVSCGKSTLVLKSCEQATTPSLEIYTIHSHNCTSAKSLLDHIEKCVNYNLLSALENAGAGGVAGGGIAKVIIIDDIDILISADRCIASTLFEFISKRRIQSTIKIICICSSDKRLGDLKRHCQIITLPPATDKDIVSYLRSLTAHPGQPAPDYKAIAKQAGGSFSMSTTIMNNMASERTGSDAPTESYEQLFKGPSRDIARNIVEEDIRAIPLRFHENLPRELATRQHEHRKKCYIDILRNMIEWDVMMVNSENATMATEHFLASPCSILAKIPYAKVKGANVADLQEFTKLLSRLSLQKKSIRALHNTGLPWQDAPYILQRKGAFFSS